jgi:hypothetical protein
VIELYIDFSGDMDRREKNEQFFNNLLACKEIIEKEIGSELKWELLPNNLSCRVSLERNNVQIASIPDDLYNYAIQKMKQFRDSLSIQIKKIIDSNW